MYTNESAFLTRTTTTTKKKKKNPIAVNASASKIKHRTRERFCVAYLSCVCYMNSLSIGSVPMSLISRKLIGLVPVVTRPANGGSVSVPISTDSDVDDTWGVAVSV